MMTPTDQRFRYYLSDPADPSGELVVEVTHVDGPHLRVRTEDGRMLAASFDDLYGQVMEP